MQIIEKISILNNSAFSKCITRMSKFGSDFDLRIYISCLIAVSKCLNRTIILCSNYCFRRFVRFQESTMSRKPLICSSLSVRLFHALETSIRDKLPYQHDNLKTIFVFCNVDFERIKFITIISTKKTVLECFFQYQSSGFIDQEPINN